MTLTVDAVQAHPLRRVVGDGVAAILKKGGADECPQRLYHVFPPTLGIVDIHLATAAGGLECILEGVGLQQAIPHLPALRGVEVLHADAHRVSRHRVGFSHIAAGRALFSASHQQNGRQYKADLPPSVNAFIFHLSSFIHYYLCANVVFFSKKMLISCVFITFSLY